MSAWSWAKVVDEAHGRRRGPTQEGQGELPACQPVEPTHGSATGLQVGRSVPPSTAIVASNEDDTSVTVDEDDCPARGCAACSGGLSRGSADLQSTSRSWRCARCEPRPPQSLAHALAEPHGNDPPPVALTEAPLPASEAEDAPPWSDDRAWLRRYTTATSREVRRSVVLAWALAAGGRPSDDGVALPALPKNLALVDLRRLARDVGLPVGRGQRAMIGRQATPADRMAACADERACTPGIGP